MENASTTLLPIAAEKKICHLHLTHPKLLLTAAENKVCQVHLMHPKLGMVPISNKIPLNFSLQDSSIPPLGPVICKWINLEWDLEYERVFLGRVYESCNRTA